MTYQNLWDTAKAVLREKFIAMMHILKGQKDLNDLMLHLKLLEKQEQTNHKTNRRRDNKNKS
jgi:hypothetical protein